MMWNLENNTLKLEVSRYAISTLVNAIKKEITHLNTSKVGFDCNGKVKDLMNLLDQIDMAECYWNEKIKVEEEVEEEE